MDSHGQRSLQMPFLLLAKETQWPHVTGQGNNIQACMCMSRTPWLHHEADPLGLNPTPHFLLLAARKKPRDESSFSHVTFRAANSRSNVKPPSFYEQAQLNSGWVVPLQLPSSSGKVSLQRTLPSSLPPSLSLLTAWDAGLRVL